MNEFQTSDNVYEQIIVNNIKLTVRSLKRKGIVKMSLENLFMVTPTPSLNHCTQERFSQYRTTFERLAKQVVLNFLL